MIILYLYKCSRNKLCPEIKPTIRARLMFVFVKLPMYIKRISKHGIISDITEKTEDLSDFDKTQILWFGDWERRYHKRRGLADCLHAVDVITYRKCCMDNHTTRRRAAICHLRCINSSCGDTTGDYFSILFALLLKDMFFSMFLLRMLLNSMLKTFVLKKFCEVNLKNSRLYQPCVVESGDCYAFFRRDRRVTTTEITSSYNSDDLT